jgi:hypothetical protein
MKEGKNLLLLIVLIAATCFANAQTQYSYTVRLDGQYRSKDILAMTTDYLDVTNRYITPEGFIFKSTHAYTNEFMKQHFGSFGIPVLGFVSERTEGVQAGDEEKAGGNNCGNAGLLCSNTSQSGNSSGPGTQELTTTNRGCLSVEHQSSWYYLNIQNPGVLTFTIDPTNNGDDYDFALWGPFTSTTAAANCPPVTAPLRCSYSSLSDQTGLIGSVYGQISSTGCGFWGLQPCYGTATITDFSEGASGNSWVAPVNALANQVYILLIDNFSSSSNPYAMNFTGSSVLGCTPVVLPVELSDFKGFKAGSQNILRWTTESEHNSSEFAVEWTSDPVVAQWTEIGRTSAQGNSSSASEYQLAHVSPDSRRINYYRLVQYDLDGNKRIYDERVIAIDNMDTRKILRIVDLTGRDANELTRGVVIYQYDDGTTEKVFQ